MLGESVAWREGETEARKENVSHQWGVGELGFPPLGIKTNIDEQRKTQQAWAQMQDWCLSRVIKSSPLRKLAPMVPCGRDDAGDRRGWRVPQTELCYAGTEPGVGGGRPSPDLRKQTGRQVGSSPLYLLRL